MFRLRCDSVRVCHATLQNGRIKVVRNYQAKLIRDFPYGPEFFFPGLISTTRS